MHRLHLTPNTVLTRAKIPGAGHTNGAEISQRLQWWGGNTHAAAPAPEGFAAWWLQGQLLLRRVLARADVGQYTTTAKALVSSTWDHGLWGGCGRDRVSSIEYRVETGDILTCYDKIRWAESQDGPP